MKTIATFGVNRFEAKELWELLVNELKYRTTDIDYHTDAFVKAHGIECVNSIEEVLKFIHYHDKEALRLIEELTTSEIHHETLLFQSKSPLAERQWIAVDVTLDAKHPSVISEYDHD